jgi:hypothetical protein
MNEILKALLWQMLGYLIAMGFSFVLMSFWMRGYFLAYIRVRTSLGKLLLVKKIEPIKIHYKVGKVEDGNLIIGKPGQNGEVYTDIKRDYIYPEQNVNCVDIDAITGAFIPKEVHYAKVLKPIPADADPAQYSKVFKKDGNYVVVTGIEGFDPGKVDSFVQAAQFRPSAMFKTMQMVLILIIVTLLVSLISTGHGFIVDNNVKATDGHVGECNGKIGQLLEYTQPKINQQTTTSGLVVATNRTG